VGTFFGVYELGADGIMAARRERGDVVALDESMQELDRTFDALVAEAVHAPRPDSPSVTSVRALTGLEVWQALRDEGATPEAAVDHASVAVERWLETHPAR
jgi:hypothetical protein